jgi:Ca2+:H+ antiporter
MAYLIKAFRDMPQLWLLLFVPIALAAHRMAPGAQTLVFLLSVLAIVPLAMLLSLATKQVAAHTGDTLGGLLNATLGNLTELVIALSALRAGEYVLVKASLAGAIVTNTLFMTGACFLLGGLRHHSQKFGAANVRLQVTMLFLAAFALMVPSAVAAGDRQTMSQPLSAGIAVILIATYALGLFFTLSTHKVEYSAPEHGGSDEEVWPMSLAFIVLGVATVFVALVSEVFVGSLEAASSTLGLSPAFIGFVVVALVGAAAEMLTAFDAARRDRLDLSVSISFGSASQIALFVAPVLVLLSYVLGPQPMTLDFWPGAVIMIFVATFTSAFVANSGTSAWYLGVLMLMVYAIFALTMYLLPPG